MQNYQLQFIEFALSLKALCFGEFKLKSGRLSPYFFNSGLFNSGASLAKLGNYYAQAIVASMVKPDVLYGPAYKGIPLAAATAVALAEHHLLDVPYAFNRKEAKDHGEGGTIVGSALKGRVLIIDDVISAGTSVRESVDIIKTQGAQVAAVVVALDRQERGNGALSAIQEVELDFGIKVFSIINLGNLVEYLSQTTLQNDNTNDLKQYAPAIKRYRATYGVDTHIPSSN